MAWRERFVMVCPIGGHEGVSLRQVLSTRRKNEVLILKHDLVMSDFDKELVKKAEGFRCWDYRKVDDLIDMAETDEGREALRNIRWELYELVEATI